MPERHPKRQHRPHIAGAPAPIAAVVAALLPLESRQVAPGSTEARRRREVGRELERLTQRAIWRAERASRRVPRHVSRSESWIQGRRRQIAYSIMRAIASLGAGAELARKVAERAALRFPRDGIVEPDPPRDSPRARGEAPRDVGTNPRSTGENPRARGSSPRQKRRRAAELDDDAAVATWLAHRT